ncbi:hypothetical protein SAMD00019534_054380 [Acytostelium subglobosum LB1]|uniref:hypothetical protein n=1 Tax=Acytostelium subglobosum LB1 TaxID=1410327 RepID=UPI000644A217|nr:hypothetical protein SAMD00019534_054380 [Acytostelium subglobosum LB1]GAM22263.1 hypothetical protein SAMD00019534_054380 [Acytostelium subglobosum LB1]|eukprot:XP_012754383.1 hypothetical protein SAMD00019534_054380 [Acytostelium subglobosum LB1]
MLSCFVRSRAPYFSRLQLNGFVANNGYPTTLISPSSTLNRHWTSSTSISSNGTQASNSTSSSTSSTTSSTDYAPPSPIPAFPASRYKPEMERRPFLSKDDHGPSSKGYHYPQQYQHQQQPHIHQKQQPPDHLKQQLEQYRPRNNPKYTSYLSTHWADKNPLFEKQEVLHVPPLDKDTFQRYMDMHKSETLVQYLRDHNGRAAKLTSEVLSIMEEADYWIACALVSYIISPKVSGSPDTRPPHDIVQLVLTVSRYVLNVKKQANSPRQELIMNLVATFAARHHFEAINALLMDSVKKDRANPAGDEHITSMFRLTKLLHRLQSEYIDDRRSSNLLATYFDADHKDWSALMMLSGLSVQTRGLVSRLERSSDINKEFAKIINNEMDVDHTILPAFIVHNELVGSIEMVECVERLLPGCQSQAIVSKITNTVILLHLLTERYEMALHWYSRRIIMGLVPNQSTIYPFIVYHEFKGDGHQAMMRFWEQLLLDLPIDKTRRGHHRMLYKRKFIKTIGQVSTNPGTPPKTDDYHERSLEHLLERKQFRSIEHKLHNHYFSKGLLPHGTFLIRMMIDFGGLRKWHSLVLHSPDYFRAIAFRSSSYVPYLRDDLAQGWRNIQNEMSALTLPNIEIINSTLCGLLNSGHTELAVNIILKMFEKNVTVYSWIYPKVASNFVELGYLDERYFTSMPSSNKECRALFQLNMLATRSTERAYAYLRMTTSAMKTRPFLIVVANLFDTMHGLKDTTNVIKLMDFFGTPKTINMSNLYSALFYVIEKKGGLGQLTMNILKFDKGFFKDSLNLTNHHTVADILSSLAAESRLEGAREHQVEIFKKFTDGEPHNPSVHLERIRRIMTSTNNILRDPDIDTRLAALPEYVDRPVPQEILDDISEKILGFLNTLE